MVNAVMDAIALLSSLATDLDLMLNDLRSTPAQQQIIQSTASNRTNPPVTIFTSQKYNQDITRKHMISSQQYQQHWQHRQPTACLLSFGNKATHPETELSFNSGSSYSTGSINQGELFLGDTLVTAKNQKLMRSSDVASTIHQQSKLRRLPFFGAEPGGGGRENISLANGNSLCSDDIFHTTDDDIVSCENELLDDDLQALLPNCHQLSSDELNQSRVSLASSSDGEVLAEGETSSESSTGSSNPPCDLGLVERLLRTHPVWFLPGIQRAGAVHLLQGKEEGNFIVRGSSQPNTMAVSVRLPPETGPYIEHYLIQSNESVLSLESSRFKFDSIPALIAHYAQCCDELPVQLCLPRALHDAKNRQQLSSLALLGQELWRYPMASPKPEAKSPNSLTDTSGIGTATFSPTTTSQIFQEQQLQQKKQQQNSKILSPTNPLNNGIFSQAGTPSDTNSSLSSFTTSNGHHQLMSPESIDSIILTMSPIDNRLTAVNNLDSNNSSGKLTTFKSNNQATKLSNDKIFNPEQTIRNERPTPPNTLNLAPFRTPPAPPVRWSKPSTPISPLSTAISNESTSNIPPNNFTVTTTVTFSVDSKNTQQIVEVTSPSVPNILTYPQNSIKSTAFQTFSKRLSPEGECKTNSDTLSSQNSSNKWQSQNSKDSNQKKLLSPDNAVTHLSGRQRKNKARKESKHYQESDILESPQIYCRSTLGDKISDYEDLWTQDINNCSTGTRQIINIGTNCKQNRRPDLLPETPINSTLSSNILSPTIESTNRSLTAESSTNLEQSEMEFAGKEIANIDSKKSNESLQIFGPIDSHKKISRLTPEKQTSSVQPSKPRHDLILQQVNTEEKQKCDQISLTTSILNNSHNKHGSPFYAEPADALRCTAITNTGILRRSQRGVSIPTNHRHSEPSKFGIKTKPLSQILSPVEVENTAGSLDELKKKQSKKLPCKLDPWPVDKSWEFMGNSKNHIEEDIEDYDTEDKWNESHIKTSQKLVKPLTVHQIIAKRLPGLNLPEIVRCSTPQGNENGQQSHEVWSTFNEINNQRISSYDNVERNGLNSSYTTSVLNGLDSAQSDDSTVFSEPWDNSQWDSFLPHDDNSETIHLSKCRPALCNSEDETIIEETTLKNSQGTHKAKQQRKQTGTPTILRSRSCGDREIFCHPRNKKQNGGPGDTIRDYTLELANDHTTTFARNIENFIACTKESREPAPQVVMRNMRQFMSGMKNYLVKHGENDFHQEVQKARSKLKSDEFLNLDAILEVVMHQLVVLPLREHLYGMFVDYYTRTGDIQLLVENVRYACARNPSEFGIRSTLTAPSLIALNHISVLLQKLQEAELPLEKLELFLYIIATIFDATGSPRGQLGADDFLPILVFVVAKCGFIGAEIEAEYMWGLLQPPLLSGEHCYYLTALCSAVHVLKSFMASENEGTGSLDWRSSSLPACSSVLRVIIPDECNGSLQTRTLPVRPHTTTREVCRIIAHKARITNPQDYALFKLVDGEETLLADAECPQDARFEARGKHCMLAYKRIDAKIAWPTITSSSFA